VCVNSIIAIKNGQEGFRRGRILFNIGSWEMWILKIQLGLGLGSGLGCVLVGLGLGPG
jgi:hypothetical protein